MKFTVNQKVLSENLSLVSRAIPSRPTHPVLGNVLVAAHSDDQILELTGFDLALGIKVSISANIEQDGALTLPAKLLNDIVSRLPDGDITVTTEGEQATIKYKGGKYQIQAMSADDYPSLPAFDPDSDERVLPPAIVHIESSTLIQHLKLVLFAVSADESKQVLTGVNFAVQGDTNFDQLSIASTDGHRLSVVSGVVNSTDTLNCTIPARALQEICKVAEKSGDPIEMFIRESLLTVSIPQVEIVSRLTDGQYPNYNALIPKQFSRTATIDRRELLDSLERIAILADQKNGVVKMSFDSSGPELVVTAEAQDVGSGSEILPIQYAGEDMVIAFNVKYLIQGLKAMSASEVMFQMNTERSPVVITPLGDIKMTYLVMPVQTRE